MPFHLFTISPDGTPPQKRPLKGGVSGLPFLPTGDITSLTYLLNALCALSCPSLYSSTVAEAVRKLSPGFI